MLRKIKLYLTFLLLIAALLGGKDMFGWENNYIGLPPPNTGNNTGDATVSVPGLGVTTAQCSPGTTIQTIPLMSGDNRSPNSSERATGYPVFKLDTAGANVFHDGNKFTAQPLRIAGFPPAPVTADMEMPSNNAASSSSQTQTTQTSICNFESSGWCNITHSPPGETVSYSNEGLLCAYSNTQITYWGVPNRAAELKVASYDMFPLWLQACQAIGDRARVWSSLTFSTPDRAIRVEYDYHVDLQYDVYPLTIYVDGVLLGTRGTNSVYRQHESIPLNPPGRHTIMMVLSATPTGSGYTNSALIDNIVVLQGSTSAPRNNSTCPSGTTAVPGNARACRYTVSIDNVNGNGGWANSLPVVTNQGSPYFAVQMSTTQPPQPLYLRGTIGPSGDPVTEMWLALVGGRHYAISNTVDFRQRGLTFPMAGRGQFFTVEAGEAFNGGGAGRFITYPLNLAADDLDPVFRLSDWPLSTLPNLGLVLPWLGAELAIDVQDDLQLKGLQVTDNAGGIPVFSSDFSDSAYTMGSVPNPLTGRVVLSPAEVRQLPVIPNTPLPTLALRINLEDVSGRRGHTNFAARVFDPPSTAKISCDRYALKVGQPAICRWDGLPGAYGNAVPHGLKVAFKAWKREGGRSISRDNLITADGNRATFTPDAGGQYDLEAVLLTSDDKFLGKRTTNVARFNVPSIPVRPVVATGLDETALVCPGDLPCGENDSDVKSFDILRRKTGAGGYQKIATVPRRDFLDSCYLDDEGVSLNRSYQYQIQGNLRGGGKTDKSNEDLANVQRYASEFRYNHVPMEDEPMRFEMKAWVNPAYPASDFAIRLFPYRGNPRDYCFMKPNAAGVMDPQCIPVERGALFKTGALHAWDEGKAIGWFKFTDQALSRYGARDLEIMMGDLALKYNLLKPAYIDIALGAMKADIAQIPIDQYQFHGDALSYQTHSFGLVYDLSLPVLPDSLIVAMNQFYFDPNEHGGLLCSDEWRAWADAHRGELFPTAADMTDLTPLNCHTTEAIYPSVQALAIRDAISLVFYDQQPGNNLFRTGAQLHLDWMQAFDAIFYRPYLQPFLETDGLTAGDKTLLTNTLVDFFHAFLLAYWRIQGNPSTDSIIEMKNHLRHLAEYSSFLATEEETSRNLSPWPGEDPTCGGQPYCIGDAVDRFPKCADEDYDFYKKKFTGYDYDGSHVDGYLEILGRWTHIRPEAFQRVMAMLSTLQQGGDNGKLLFRELSRYTMGEAPIPSSASIPLQILMNKKYCTWQSRGEAMTTLLHEGTHVVHHRDIRLRADSLQRLQGDRDEAVRDPREVGTYVTPFFRLLTKYEIWTEYRAFRMQLCRSMEDRDYCSDEKDFMNMIFFGQDSPAFYRRNWSRNGICTQNHDGVTSVPCTAVDSLDWTPFGGVCNPFTDARGDCSDLP